MRMICSLLSNSLLLNLSWNMLSTNNYTPFTSEYNLEENIYKVNASCVGYKQIVLSNPQKIISN